MYLQKEMSKKLFFLIVFCWHLDGQWRKQQDPGPHPDPDPNPDPDPIVRGMDPRIRIRIHTKISGIRNTVILTPSRSTEETLWQSERSKISHLSTFKSGYKNALKDNTYKCLHYACAYNRTCYLHKNHLKFWVEFFTFKNSVTFKFACYV